MPHRQKKPASSMLDALKTLLLAETVSTHDEIKLALEKLGHDANQSKISRLLRKLGAVKMTNEYKQMVYSLPLEPAPPASKIILSQLIINITVNETLIVIHTNPGSASLIGRLLDHHRDELSMLGTVAGDDTVFIAPTSVKSITQTLRSLKTFLSEMR
jgi:transcriptional regulator of arginine metabolism